MTAIPLPKNRPANTQVAAAAPQPDKPASFVQRATNYVLAAVTPNDIIKARGYWVGLPETPFENSAARRRPAETASADPEETGSIGPFAAPEGYGERQGGYSLAFASQQPEPAAQRAKPMGSTMPRKAAVAANTTVAFKGTAEEPSEVLSHTDQLISAQQRPDSPWLRALILTPSVQGAMSTTLFGLQDFRNLRPLLQKPNASLVMTFSRDPMLGMSHQRFGGSAISFLATATFAGRTATLQ